MKPNHRNLFAAASALAFTAAPVLAQTAWDGGAGTTDYATATNWAADIIPGDSNTNGALIGNSSNQTVVYSTATGYTSTGTGKANSLLVGTGTNGVGSLTLNGSAGTLTFGGDGYSNAAWIGSAGGNTNATGTVTVSAGKLAITGGTDASMNLGVFISGTAGGIKSGTLIINGGTVEVGRRILMGANANSAIGVLTISSGTLDMKRTGLSSEGDLGFIRLGQGNNTVNFDGGTAILSGLHISGASNARSNIYFNGTTLRANVANADFLIGTAANANLQIKNGGLILDTNNLAVGIDDVLSNFTGETGFLRKEGLGTLTLSGANTYAGATAIRNGTLALGGGNDRLPTGTTVTLGDGVANTNGILRLDSRSQQLAGLVTAGTGTGNRVTNGNATAATLTLNIASGTNTFGGILGGTGTNENNFALTKSGSGTLSLTRANTYTGATNVNGGTLRVSGAGSLGSGAATVSGTGSILDLARNDTWGNHSTSVQALTIQSGGLVTNGTATNSGFNQLQTLALDGGELRVTGTARALTDGPLFKFEAYGIRNTVTVTGTAASSITNPTSITNAGINIGGHTDLGGGIGSSLTFNVADVTGSSAADLTVSAVLKNNYTAGSFVNLSNGLTKTGAGTMTLAATNAYTGATAVNVGTLLINGSISTSSLTTVASGATLGGSGSVGALTVQDNGTLAPGTLIGALSSGTVSLANLSNLNFELNPADFTIGGGINDLVSVTGNLTLDGILNLTPTSGDFLSAIEGNAWRLFNYSGTLTDNTLNLGSMPSLGTGLGWSIDTATSGQVNLVVIPEPSVALLVGLGSLALLRRRRR